ncbi:MAG: GtrA family protein [Eubacterium sp.]|nr:GtrA family protein [Eubacterium sp.]
MPKKKWNWKFVRQLLNKEVVCYAVSGGMVTLANAACYFLLLEAGAVYTAANIISLLFAKAAGYFLNKLWVFHSKCGNWMQTGTELLRYIAARGFTGLLDFFGVVFLVEYAGIGARASKILLMGVVVILNYVLEKKMVFISKSA